MGQCLDRQIYIYTTKERYTFDNSINSKVLCFAFGLVAEIERNLISMRTKEALAVKKAEGVVLGRRPGSNVKMEVLRQNEARIEAMLAAGLSVTKVCRKIGVSRNTWYKYIRVKQDSFC
jgi:DNA invertase Pin-like site-specific DNA recombinase